MQARSRFLVGLGAMGMALVLSALPLSAQEAAAAIGERMAKSQEELKSYTWMIRTEVQIKGKAQPPKLEKARYDLDGKVQKTLMSPPPAPETASQPSGRRRGRGRVKNRIIEKKKGEIQELVKGLTQTATGYLKAYPQQLKEFFARAHVTRGVDAEAGILFVEGEAFLKPEDKVSYRINLADSHPEKIDVHTIYDDEPFQVTAEFVVLPEGPVTMGRLVLDYPEDEIHIKVENYDYQRSN